MAATKAEQAEARRLLAALLEQEDGPAPEPYRPPPAPTGWALVGVAAEEYAGSLRPWRIGLGLLAAGIIAGQLDPPALLILTPLLALGGRLWTARTIRRHNRAIERGDDPDGRTVSRGYAARLTGRSTAAWGAGGGWLLTASLTGQTVGLTGAVGALFWTVSALLWAALFVPAWNTARGRRTGLTDRPTDRAYDGLTPPVNDPTDRGVGDSLTARTKIIDRPVKTEHVARTFAPVNGPAWAVEDTAELPTVRPNEDQVDRAVNVEPTGYRLPPLTLLAAGSAPPRRPPVNANPHAKTINGVLLEHNVSGRVVESVPGPTVTRHVIALGRGVKVAAFMRLDANLRKALGDLQIALIAAVPDRDAVAVDVPTPTRGIVTLGDLLRSARSELAAFALGVGVGFTVDGTPEVTDLTSKPHILIAGASGGGKSVSLNALLVSLLMQHSPDTLGLLLIDPKQVELACYETLPHLVAPIVVGYDEAIGATEAIIAEMDRRYRVLRTAGCRDIAAYNGKVAAGLVAGPRMRRLVVAVDELADLMLTNKARRRAARRGEEAEPDFEDLIVRLLQKARAAGIHLILATQRPSKDVITGLITANLPARLALAVADLADSMVILGVPGAERLLGAGDALWQPQGRATTRIQGARVTDAEIDAVVAFCAAQAAAAFDLPAAPVREYAPPPVVVEPVARDVVLEAARLAADEDGLVHKPRIVAATPEMRPGTRDKALTDLVGDGQLERVEGRKGMYRITEPTPDVDGAGSSEQGEQ